MYGWYNWFRKHKGGVFVSLKEKLLFAAANKAIDVVANQIDKKLKIKNLLKEKANPLPSITKVLLLLPMNM